MDAVKNRKKALLINTITSIVLQVTVIACGFIVPRLLLSAFGSEANGLANSIAQFLSVIAFLDMGVGAVVQSRFYKSLSDNDRDETSRIAKTGRSFFRKIAFILLAYVVVLSFTYPFFNQSTFDYWYIVSLVASIGIGYFFQYYFGVVDGLLVQAGQRNYVLNTIQAFSYVLNAVLTYAIIQLGGSLQVVKLVSSFIFLLRPFVLWIAVKKHYDLDMRIKVEADPIKQKWNGLAQHISTIILDCTDIVVLTLFTDYATVSIYSVYKLVVHNIYRFLEGLFTSVESILGEYWNKGKIKEYEKLFRRVTWALHTSSTFIYAVAAMLIVQFVQVYTSGVQDADYYQPVFAYLITAAYWVTCIRINYTLIVRSTCMFKQTQLPFIVSSLVNVGLSIAFVKAWGLIGVTIGTVAAMLVQTIWLAIFTSKNVLKGSIWFFVKQCVIDLLITGSIAAATFWLPFGEANFGNWLILALEVGGISVAIMLFFNIVFFRKELLYYVSSLKKRIHGGRK